MIRSLPSSSLSLSVSLALSLSLSLSISPSSLLNHALSILNNESKTKVLLSLFYLHSPISQFLANSFPHFCSQHDTLAPFFISLSLCLSRSLLSLSLSISPSSLLNHALSILNNESKTKVLLSLFYLHSPISQFLANSFPHFCSQHDTLAPFFISLSLCLSRSLLSLSLSLYLSLFSTVSSSFDSEERQ